MQLTKEQRRDLRQAMLAAFDPNALSLFLEDWLDISLANAVQAGDPFEAQCQKLIKWAESVGKIDELYRAFQQHHTNPGLNMVVIGILATKTTSTAPEGEAARPFLINKRPVLNRQGLWERLKVFAAGNKAIDRILIVTGEAATGKTYSQWMISHVFAPHRQSYSFALVDLTQGTDAEVDGVTLAERISDRLWPQEIANGTMKRFDDLAQPARETRNIGDLLVGRLTALQKPTWILIDGLNAVRIGKTAVDLLVRLCHAIEIGECSQLWLILIGMKPDQFGPEVALYVPFDKTSRPNRQDIEEFLVWFVTDISRAEAAVALGNHIDQLDATLPAQPTHDAWIAFHQALVEKCQGIRQGMLP